MGKISCKRWRGANDYCWMLAAILLLASGGSSSYTPINLLLIVAGSVLAFWQIWTLRRVIFGLRKLLDEIVKENMR